MYALIDKDTGEVLQYPYSITSLVRANKHVCWPRVISDELAAEFGCVRVADVEAPAEGSDEAVEELPPTRVNDELRRTYLKRTLTPEEFDARRQAKAREMRDKRDRLLAESDWTQLLDTPQATQVAWAAYRALVRDVTKQPGFPFDITWPTKP